MPKKGWVELSPLKLTHGSLRSFGKTIRRSFRKSIWLLLPFAIFSISVVRAAPALPPACSTLMALAAETAIAQADTPKTEPDFPLQPHPLPLSLAQWHGPMQTGDYFDQVEVVPVGYLVWTHFPITVYIQPPTAAELAIPFRATRSQAWVTAVSQAVQSWQPYLPLQLVKQADGADITVWRTERSSLVLSPVPPASDRQTSTPSDQTQRDQRPTLQLGRARSAVTSYKVYVKGVAQDGTSKESASQEGASKPMLAQCFTIQLRPDQAPSYIQAAARHELGHALGIWGHSRSQTDVMYFSQVRNPPPISSRDLNTLKRIYEQPTRLGWALSE